MARCYYNEWKRHPAAWLRELIKDGLIAPGDVDERDIREVKPEDLRGYDQHHFFAGIGGWSYALRLAGWPDDRPVWTASLPCQPYSSAGKKKGFADERDLWPAFRELVTACKPELVLGEQVDKAIGYGWLDRVYDGMERQGYTCGAVVFPACSVGAPHLRQRLYWTAISDGSGGLGNAAGVGQSGGEENGGRQRTDVLGSRFEPSVWRDSYWLTDRDGKARRVPFEPALFPLADGLPGRVGILRGAGNAIVPPLAAEFIKTVMEVLEEKRG